MDIDDDAAALVRQILGIARHRLGVELTWMSRFEDGQQVFTVLDGDADGFGLTPGDSSPLEGSFCIRVLDGRLPNSVPDAAHHPETAGLDVTEALGIGRYVGVPVRQAGGGTYGMICGVSHTAGDEVEPAVIDQLELLADVIGIQLREASRTAEQQQEARRDVERWLDPGAVIMHFSRSSSSSRATPSDTRPSPASNPGPGPTSPSPRRPTWVSATASSTRRSALRCARPVSSRRHATCR